MRGKNGRSASDLAFTGRRSNGKREEAPFQCEGSEGRIGFLTIGVGVVVAAVGVAVVVGVLVAGGRAVVAAVVGVALFVSRLG